MKVKYTYNQEPSFYKIVEDIRKAEDKYKKLYNKHKVTYQTVGHHRRVYILNVELY